jgi:hypothetical protein
VRFFEALEDTVSDAQRIEFLEETVGKQADVIRQLRGDRARLKAMLELLMGLLEEEVTSQRRFISAAEVDIKSARGELERLE